jgi:hypothetical protein
VTEKDDVRLERGGMALRIVVLVDIHVKAGRSRAVGVQHMSRNPSPKNLPAGAVILD